MKQITYLINPPNVLVIKSVISPDLKNSGCKTSIPKLNKNVASIIMKGFLH